MKKILLAAMLVFGMLVSAMALAPSEFEKNATPENAVLVYGFYSVNGEDNAAILFTNFDKTKQYVSTITQLIDEIEFRNYNDDKRIKEVNCFWGFAYPNSTYNHVYYIVMTRAGNYYYLSGVGYETDYDFTTKQAGTLQYLGDYPWKMKNNLKGETLAKYETAERKAKVEALKIILRKFKKGTHWYDVVKNEIEKIEGELKNEK